MRKLFVCLLLWGGLLFAPVGAKAAEPLRLGLPRSMDATVVYMAEHEGYFRDEGVDVRITFNAHSRISNDAVIAGHADASGTTDGPLTYLSFNADHPLRVVAQTGSAPETTLVARKDEGITTEADIRGKRIGYLPGTGSYLFLERLLEKLGLQMGDIQPVVLQPSAMPLTLQGKSIDAFVMWEPWADQAAKALGDNAVQFRCPDAHVYKVLLVVADGFAKKHPDKIAAVLRALLKAEVWVKDHPDETIRVMSQLLSLDEAVIRKHWKDYDFTVGLDDSILTTMREDARYVIRDDPNFAGKAIPDFNRYIEPKFLREVAPERVTLP